MHGHNLRMPQLSRSPGFSQEQLRIGRIDLVAPGNLDGYQPVELRVAGLPDRSETTRAELFQQLKVADRSRGRRVEFGGRNQAERTATRGAGNIPQLAVAHDFHRVMAVRAPNVHSPAPPRRPPILTLLPPNMPLLPSPPSPFASLATICWPPALSQISRKNSDVGTKYAICTYV